MSIQIRPSTISDLPFIVAIYNEAIAKKGLTADLEELQVEDRREWFDEHSVKEFPLLVAEENNAVVGWISLSPYRKGRKALEATTEVSLYIANSHIGRGVGSDMMQSIIAVAKELGYRNIIAILIASNQRSIALFNKFKFERWGTLPGIIEIDGQTFDHAYYGLKI